MNRKLEFPFVRSKKLLPSNILETFIYKKKKINKSCFIEIFHLDYLLNHLKLGNHLLYYTFIIIQFHSHF